MTQPTQVTHPWRSTLRTVVAATLALLPALPAIAAALGLSTIPWVVSGLAALAAVQRVLVMPQVETALRRFAPWLAAQPATQPAASPAADTPPEAPAAAA